MKSYAIYRMVSFPVTLNDLSKSRYFSKANIPENGAFFKGTIGH